MFCQSRIASADKRLPNSHFPALIIFILCTQRGPFDNGVWRNSLDTIVMSCRSAGHLVDTGSFSAKEPTRRLGKMSVLKEQVITVTQDQNDVRSCMKTSEPPRNTSFPRVIVRVGDLSWSLDSRSYCRRYRGKVFWYSECIVEFVVFFWMLHLSMSLYKHLHLKPDERM